jgi:hypothetical protein
MDYLWYALIAYIAFTLLRFYIDMPSIRLIAEVDAVCSVMLDEDPSAVTLETSAKVSALAMYIITFVCYLFAGFGFPNKRWYELLQRTDPERFLVLFESVQEKHRTRKKVLQRVLGK